MTLAPLLDSVPSGNHPLDGRPIFMLLNGHESTAASANPIASARPGWWESHRAHLSHAVGLWYQASLRASQWGQSILFPKMANPAGKSVTASNTASVTTSNCKHDLHHYLDS